MAATTHASEHFTINAAYFEPSEISWGFLVKPGLIITVQGLCHLASSSVRGVTTFQWHRS
jgi:hypothetical protein